MRRTIMLGLVLAFGLVAVSADAATQCRDPKTKAFIKCPTAAASTKTTTKPKMTLPTLGHPATTTTTTSKPGVSKPTMTGTKKPPVCKTGVVCGNACIPKGKVCHK